MTPHSPRPWPRQLPKPVDMSLLLSNIEHFLALREKKDPLKLIPYDTVDKDIPLSHEEADQRLKRLTPVTAQMSAFPWRDSAEGESK